MKAVSRPLRKTLDPANSYTRTLDDGRYVIDFKANRSFSEAQPQILGAAPARGPNAERGGDGILSVIGMLRQLTARISSEPATCGTARILVVELRHELAISDGAWLCRPLYSQSFLNLTKPKVSTLTRERQVRWVRSGR